MYSQNYDISRTAYSGFVLPPQAIPTKEKNPDWIAACLDSLENIAVRQITRNVSKYSSVYRILEGDYEYTDVMSSSLFVSEVDNLRSQAQVGKKLNNYGFIEPIVNDMIGEFIKSPNPITIDATDAFSTNDYIEFKTEKLWKGVTAGLEDRLNQKMLKMGIDPYQTQFESEEESQQYQQQLQQFKQENTPKEVDDYMNTSWKAIYIQWAEETMKEDYGRFDLDELDRNNLYDFLATGKCFRHIRTGYDYYMPEHWSVLDTFYDDNAEKTEEGDYAGRLKYMTGNQIIAMIGHKLTEKQQKAILRSKDSKNYNYKSRSNQSSTTKSMLENWGGGLELLPNRNMYPYQNAKWIQDETGVDLGMQELFPNGNHFSREDYFSASDRTDLIRVTEGYWVSQQKVGLITIEEEEGEVTTETVTDELIPKYLKEFGIKTLKETTIEDYEKNPEPNTIVWTYNPIVHYGIKISKENTDLDDDLYIDGDAIEYQLKGESETFHTKIPVVGINERTSFVSRMEQEQIDYNICLNMARDYAQKEIGIFFLMDLAALPHNIKDLGDEEMIPKLMDIARESGFLPIDSDPSNTRSNFNQFQMVNMDLTQAMLGKLQYAQSLKRMAYEKIGYNPERLGTPTQQTATGIEQATRASFNQTEIWFDKFSKFQKRYGEVHLNVAQYMKKDGVDGTVMFTDSDKTKVFLNMSDPYLPLRRFRIGLENNAQRRSELEIIKSTYMKDNTIEKDLESLAQVLNSDSVSKILQVARINRRMTEVNQQKAAEQRQKEIEMSIAAEAEKAQIERDWKSQEAALDRQSSIYEKQIIALGFAKEQDVNKNDVSDIVETGELTLKQMQYQTEVVNAERLVQQNATKNETDRLLAEKKLYIEEKKLDVEKYKADKTLEVARENQTEAEILANRRNKQKS